MVRLVSLTTYMLSIKLLQHLFIKFSGYRVGKPHLKKKNILEKVIKSLIYSSVKLEHI